eukprot:IDg19174t1
MFASFTSTAPSIYLPSRVYHKRRRSLYALTQKGAFITYTAADSEQNAMRNGRIVPSIASLTMRRFQDASPCVQGSLHKQFGMHSRCSAIRYVVSDCYMDLQT